MPAKTEAQANFMRAIAHGWHPTHGEYKNKELPSKKVAEEFSHMAHGGMAPHVATAMSGHPYVGGNQTTCPKCGHMFSQGGEVESDEPIDYYGDEDDFNDFDDQGRNFEDSYSGPSFANDEDAHRSFVTMIRLGHR